MTHEEAERLERQRMERIELCDQTRGEADWIVRMLTKELPCTESRPQDNKGE